MEMNNFNFVPILVVAATMLWASFEGSLSQSGVKGPPSPPLNLRRSVVGLLGANREYRMYWSASNDTGGLAVNYTVQLCVNDSLADQSNNQCKFSSGSGCQVSNISDTNINFSCTLNIMVDFRFNTCDEFCNYTVCVVATNDVGSTASCIPAPYVDPSLVTPRPPTDFSVEIEKNGDIIVRWEERPTWSAYNTVYTVIYYVPNQQTENKKVEVTNKANFVRLRQLEAFTTYCLYLMVQFVNSEGVRSAHSDRLGPLCQKTPAGGPPSPPLNLRRSVVGLLGADREYRMYWSASNDTGGLAVNYTVQLCVNDSLANQSNNQCKFSSGSGCQVSNISDTNINFSCTLNIMVDFRFNTCDEFCNYTVCVVATNDVGSTASCIPAPYVDPSLVTPRPPTDFSVEIENNGDIIVRWEERPTWSAYNTVYTVIYYVPNQQTENKKVEVTNRTNFVRLRQLEAFTTYCLYLMVQFVNSEGVRSAHSDRVGQRCQKTPAGAPINPPKIVQDQSVRFPDNDKLRNVTVKWELAKGTSWRGTPHQYRIWCYDHISYDGPMAEKCNIITDAATNSTVLQGLSTAHGYNVFVSMCNKEKVCGKRGTSYLVRKLDDQTQPSTPSPEKLSANQIALLVASSLVGVALSAIAVFFIRKWRRDERRKGVVSLRNRISIPDLNDIGPTPEYDYVNDASTYDRVKIVTGV